MPWYFANIYNAYYLCNKKITNQPNLFLYRGTAAYVDGNMYKKKFYQTVETYILLLKYC